jgi:hypothetical protein
MTEHLHNWQWQFDERWLCRDCGEYSNCTCKPTDPGPYHLPKCPRSIQAAEKYLKTDYDWFLRDWP